MNYHMAIRGRETQVYFPRRATLGFIATIANSWLSAMGYHITIRPYQLSYLRPGFPLIVGPLTLRVFRETELSRRRHQ